MTAIDVQAKEVRPEAYETNHSMSAPSSCWAQGTGGLLMVAEHRWAIHANGDAKHHAAILVDQNVAVEHVQPGVVDEAAAQLEVSRDRHVTLPSAMGNGEHVPPHVAEIVLQRVVPAWFPGRLIVRLQLTLTVRERSRRCSNDIARHRVPVIENEVAILIQQLLIGIKELGNLKRVDVNMEGMVDVDIVCERRHIRDLPFADRVQRHSDRCSFLAELLIVDGMLSRRLEISGMESKFRDVGLIVDLGCLDILQSYWEGWCVRHELHRFT